MRICWTFALWIQVVLIAGCGQPEAPSDLALEIRFARLHQAQLGSGGLPAGLGALRIDIIQPGTPGAPILGSLPCTPLAEDASERRSLFLDVIPAAAARVEVRGWEGPDCVGESAWSGQSLDFAVLQGQEVKVPVYVTERGSVLNPIAERLPAGRAFASATPLPDGRVLIAGGFDRAQVVGGALQLEAACDAWIYHPGRAKVEAIVPANACRGLHRALALPDGSVLLVGGTPRAVFDPGGAVRPVLRPTDDDRIDTVERFDPNSTTFEVLAGDEDFARAAPALALCDDDNRLLLLGGQTNRVRSSEVFTANALGLSWTPLGEVLQAPRSGARAASGSGGVLLAGGNASAEADFEWVAADGSGSGEVVPGGVGNPPDLSLTGHELVVFDSPSGGNRFVLLGGMAAPAGSVPIRTVLAMTRSSAGAWTFEWRSLARQRAYHVAHLFDGAVVAVGGLGSAGGVNGDLERWGPGGDGSLLGQDLVAGPVGMAAASLPDGSLLLAGGLRLDGGLFGLNDRAEILSP